MEIKIFSKTELDTVYRVLRTALNPKDLNEQEKIFLQTYAKINQVPLPDSIPSIAIQEIKLQETHKQKRLVQLSAMAVLLSRPVRKESVEYVDLLARHFSIREPVIRILYAILNGQKIKARLLTARRGVRAILGEAYDREGVMGIFRFFAALIWRVRVNEDKLWSYKRLGLLPEGTLGREYWKHITELGFGFPGEAGGIPETVSYHDVSHVLNDYDTTPAGEIQQGSFQGGSRRQDGFAFVQFVILQFHHGIKITPVAEGEIGNFNPAKVLWAIHRGATFKADVTQKWDYWPLMALPLREAREKCGLLPPMEEA